MELHQVQLLATAAGGFGVKLALHTAKVPQAAAAAAAAAADKVVIKQLQPGGPAELSGLQPGDIVVGIGGQQVAWGTLQAVLNSARINAGGDAVEWSVWRAREPAGKGSPGWCWAEFARRMLANARDQQRQRVAAMQQEASWQPDDAPGSWIWCWRQFARALLSASRHSPIGLAHTDVDDALHLVVAGTWAWCWDRFVRGVLSLDKRPSMRPRLRPPPQFVEPVDIASLAHVSTSSIVGCDPIAPLAAVRISDERDRSDFLVEVRKLARPEPPYGWLDGSPIVPRSAFADSPAPTTTQHRRRSNGLQKAKSRFATTGEGKRDSLRRATRRLPDGSGLLTARQVTRDHMDPITAERPAVGERWPRG